ncbi:hypothetical protein F2Q68_00015733 [Brassica cretica]|uniref:Uncharacterized protein n=1 Tax=Brassica cretica TaxID=69181 RepID=A0A8S9HFG3_BRACR|nr:hypothetical protein F2Q68_00015733 [Brassica cretica]
MQFALCSSTSDEVHHAIFKASKVVYSASYNAYLTLMKILTLQGLAVETVELKGGLLERFTHEMEPFLRKLDVSQPKIRLRPRLAILMKTLLKKNVYQEQGKLETKTVPDKACNGTSIFGSSEESKVGLDVRMCNGNGFQGVSVGLAGSMIYAPTIKKDYVGRRRSSKDSDMVEIAPPTFVLGSTTLEIQKEQDSDHDQGENQKLSLYQALSLKTLLADYLLLIAYEVKCMNNKKASFCIPRIG